MASFATTTKTYVTTLAVREFLRTANVWVVGSALLALALIAPLAMLLSGLTDAGPVWDHIAGTVLKGYVANTLILVTAVSALSLLMALPAAWFVSAFDFPGRGFFEWALVLPLAIPTYVAAFVYIQVPEAAIPLLVVIRNHWGIAAFQWTETLLRYGTLSLLMAAVLYPYVYIAARASFGRQQRSVIEAAQILGRSSTAIVFTLALPMARPAIAAGLGLVIMEVINDYGAINFFGVPTLTEGIFRTWFGLSDRASGLRLAGILLAAVLALLLLERWQRGRARFILSGDSGASLSRRRARGLAAAGMATACTLPLAVGLILPAGQLIVWVTQAFHTTQPPLTLGEVVRSLSLALVAAMSITAGALLFTYSARLFPFRWLRGLIHLAALGYAVPGAAVAVGVMVLLGRLDHAPWLPGLLSGSIAAILFAYFVRFLAVPLQPIGAGMTRICGSLDEASRMLGRGPAATLWAINLPLLRGTLAAAIMLVFVDILKELPLTMLLRPANFNTLAVTAFGLAKEGRIHECALPSLVIVCAGGLGLALLNRLLWRTA